MRYSSHRSQPPYDAVALRDEMCLEAIREGNVTKVDTLLSRGVGNQTKDEGLVLALVKGHAALVPLLLDAGADPNSYAWSWSALHYAAQSLQSDCVRALLEAGANPNTQKHCLMTPLMLLVASHMGGYTDPGSSNTTRQEIAQLLIGYGADVNLKDYSQRTALTHASECQPRYYESFIALLRQSAAVMGLVEAAMLGEFEQARTLLEQGADPNASLPFSWNQSEQRTALHYAAVHGHTEVIRLLLEYGAEPSPWNNYFPSTPLEAAVTGGHTNTVALLLAHDARLTTWRGIQHLITAISQGYTEIASELLKQGVDVNSHGIGSAMRKAAEEGHIEIIRLLIDYPGNTSLTSWKLHLALWNAARNGYTEVVLFLMQRGAEIQRKYERKTPLMAAAESGHITTVKLLMEAEADRLPAKAAEKGRVAALNAALNGNHTEVAALLRSTLPKTA